MSEQSNDGGPAFPCGPFGQTMHGEDGREWHQYDRLPGMSLRDYIAIHANDRDISPYTRKGPYGEEWDRENARYLYADAMLERRRK